MDGQVWIAPLWVEGGLVETNMATQSLRRLQWVLWAEPLEWLQLANFHLQD